MITLRENVLVFSFPEVHHNATLDIDFQRTLRIPDDNKDYPLPPGLGLFPVRHVDDFTNNVSRAWTEHGGVMLPMYQSEALWLNFSCSYPFAVKVAAGKINAVTGKEWTNSLNTRPQDYLVAPDQPWLDGYCVERGIIRQFVAMPLGSGYSAEEQITGTADHGGLQIVVYPMKREAYRRYFEATSRTHYYTPGPSYVCESSPAMGLAPGGKMKQEIYHDRYKLTDWAHEHSSRCFVHICNSLVWRQNTGQEPPLPPPTSEEYTKAGLPWFEYYDESNKALTGSTTLAGLNSANTLAKEKKENVLPENKAVDPDNIIALRKGLKKDQVREWR